MKPHVNPLRILVVVNHRWDSRLGAVRVFIELAEQWRAFGHIVETYSLSDAFPDARASSMKFIVRQLLFSRKAVAFVKKNSARFDVIDALIGSLPVTKRRLGFKGLLVARSVGLPRLYDQFERSIETRWPHQLKGKLAGRILHSLIRWRSLRAADKSIASADLINLPNEEEVSCLFHETGSENHAVLVQPYGLTIAQARALLRSGFQATVRLQQKRICFIGMWSARKGAHDWAQIIRCVRKCVPEASFCFLGTMIDSKIVLGDLGEFASESAEFVSEYQPEDLPSLLAGCTVGAFPSYVEGFGLAVIEQLAAGIPTVAYDIAGPRNILGTHLSQLLVPAGDITSFAAIISGILQCNIEEYQALSERSVAVASGFSWPTIAHDTLQAYQAALKKTGT
jgi:glycosyltransferase involved in cell wall biosynthesis